MREGKETQSKRTQSTRVKTTKGRSAKGLATKTQSRAHKPNVGTIYHAVIGPISCNEYLHREHVNKGLADQYTAPDLGSYGSTHTSP